MPTCPACFLVARYGSLVVAAVALALACADAGPAQGGDAQGGDRQVGSASRTDSSLASADRWRRTAIGWERLPVDGRAPFREEDPSEHVALAQVWPAAWAACLVLSVLSLAAAGAERKEIDARSAAGDQVGYDLGRAA